MTKLPQVTLVDLVNMVTTWLWDHRFEDHETANILEGLETRLCEYEENRSYIENISAEKLVIECLESNKRYVDALSTIRQQLSLLKTFETPSVVKYATICQDINDTLEKVGF